MQDRRQFLKSAVSTGLILSSSLKVSGETSPSTTAGNASGKADRAYWISVLEKLADPVLSHLARGELRKAMPVETFGSATKLRKYSHLEATGRLLLGMAPWLALEKLPATETNLQKKYRALAVQGLEEATNPKSPDFMNWSEGQQPLVDAAFLAQAILRAPSILWEPLDARVRGRLVEALKASRGIKPIGNNHVLFAAAIETALLLMGEKTAPERLEGNLRQMLEWYGGDGAYHDGAYFRFDYYNSFVIHPTLVDIFQILSDRDAGFKAAREIVLRRAVRYADILERTIAPDGTFPCIGRSITYRFGAFQSLGQIALMHALPPHIRPAQVRCALTAVIRRMTEAPGTFDSLGWLQVGFCGHQVELGETYISTGSLYLCSAGLLPLGLPESDPFWSDAPARWTSQKVWSGETLPADRALRDEKAIEVPNLKRS